MTRLTGTILRVRESARSFRVIPVLLPGAQRAERSSLPTFLAATTWAEFRDSLDDADAFHRFVCGIRGVEPGPGSGEAIYQGQCPYRGLRVFDVNDAAFFFGREALVEWLLNEVRPATEGQPVNRFLAILFLQHALLEVWNKRHGRRLTVKAYKEIGMLEGALRERADATLEAFSKEEQELCRRIFLRLTQPGEGAEDTKRRASMQELLSLSAKSTAKEDFIQKLADASLLTTEGDIARRDAFVEVAHEALIRSWPKLRKWIDADRAG